MNGKLKSGLKVKFIKLNLKMHVKNWDNRSKARYINQWRITFRHYKEEFHWGVVRSARAAKWFSILTSFYFISFHCLFYDALAHVVDVGVQLLHLLKMRMRKMRIIL